MRLFICIDVPHQVKDGLSQMFDLAKYDLVFSRPEKLHITVRFLGEVHADRVGEIQEKLRRVKHTGFALSLSGLGTFPEDHKAPPYVLWAGIRGADRIASLAGAISAFLGRDPNCIKRPFRPHLTLAKPTKEQAQTVQRFIKDFTPLESYSWMVDSFKLYSSPGGGGDFTLVEQYRLSVQLELF